MAAYKFGLRAVLQRLPDLPIQMVNQDFELAMLEASRSLFPKSIIHGCHFHLLQAWRRQICTFHFSLEVLMPCFNLIVKMRPLKMFT